MNTNTNVWAVEVGNPELSEVVQIIAFRYGYRWPNSGDRVNHTNEKFIVFYPDEKEISFLSDRDYAEKVCFKIVNAFDEVIKMLRNPPEVSIEVDNAIVYKNGNVSLDGSTITKEDFENLVRKRNEFLGNSTKRLLPQVTFTYKSKNVKDRIILVTAKDFNHIEGLDLDDGYKYKSFLLSNVIGAIHFVGFAEEK